MTEPTDKAGKIPNFILQTPKGTPSLELFLGNNLLTGPLLVGDKIKDPASGTLFVVVERTWLSGKDREANLLIRVDLVPQG